MKAYKTTISPQNSVMLRIGFAAVNKLTIFVSLIYSLLKKLIIMKTQKSFFNKSECTKAAKKFRSLANFGGFDGYESTNLTADQCINIADQFEAARENGGNYFSNIINYPFFNQNEIETILTAL